MFLTYAGCSRVGTKGNLFAFALKGKTRIIVYREVLYIPFAPISTHLSDYFLQ